ncbi:hypothetical protein [Rahnella woolbedingensis]|nr:hypothetical protein [Rahnella woolbedingensis]
MHPLIEQDLDTLAQVVDRNVALVNWMTGEADIHLAVDSMKACPAKV